MPTRGMNNAERQSAALLKSKGFNIIWQDSCNPRTGGQWWALHPKLICQYDLGSANEAVQDLENAILHRHTDLEQLDLFHD
jgi:hypothetical protein